MHLAEKVKHLRKVEGDLRGLKRPMTQLEVVKAMQEEQGESISQAYLSQLESGKRIHLTATSRALLARFFKVHPGYLVSDPPDLSINLHGSDLLMELDGPHRDRLQNWLASSSFRWHSDPIIQRFLTKLADLEDPRSYISVFGQLLDLPLEVLKNLPGDLMTR